MDTKQLLAIEKQKPCTKCGSNVPGVMRFVRVVGKGLPLSQMLSYSPDRVAAELATNFQLMCTDCATKYRWPDRKAKLSKSAVVESRVAEAKRLYEAKYRRPLPESAAWLMLCDIRSGKWDKLKANLLLSE